MPPRLCPLLAAASLLAIGAANPLHAQALDVERIVRVTERSTKSKRLELLANGEATLSTVAPAAGTAAGTLSPVRSRLTASEARAINRALTTPGFAQAPAAIPNSTDHLYGGPRFELRVERSGRPAHVVRGFSGNLDVWRAQVEPLQLALSQVEERLRELPAREAFLRILDVQVLVQGKDAAASRKATRAPTDASIEVVVGGPGLPGLAFDRLRVVRGPRGVLIDAVGVPRSTATAQPFRHRVKVEGIGAFGAGQYTVSINTAGPSSTHERVRLQLVAAADPRDGLFHGPLVRDFDGYLCVKIGEQKLRLLGATAAGLPDAKGAPDAVLRGRLEPSGVVVYDVLSPRYERVRAQCLSRHRGGALQLANGTQLHVRDPGAQTVLRRSSDRIVELKGWIYGLPGERSWTAAQVQIVARTDPAGAKVKRGARTLRVLSGGEPVWIDGTTWFGRYAAVRLPERKKGRMRWDDLTFGEDIPRPLRRGLAGALPN